MVYLWTLETWQGYHSYDIPDLTVGDKIQASKYDIANQLLYNPILALVKASIVFFLWRLQDRRKVIRLSFITFFIFNLSLAIATFVAGLCRCTPISYHWNRHTFETFDSEGNVVHKAGTCIHAVNFVLITTGLSVLTDILIVIIPAAMVSKLKMSKSSKIAI